MNEKENKIVSASPKTRKFARELGADLNLVKGTQREGRVSESDIKKFIKENISGKNFQKKKQKHKSTPTQILGK